VQDTRRLGALVFQGQRPGRPVSEFALGCLLRKLGHDGTTVHGFRSTLHDWAAEATSHPNIVVSQALAHAVGDKVEAAYRRGDLFEKRRALMEDWAAYLATAPAPAAALPSSAEKAMAAE
jgi:integrase